MIKHGVKEVAPKTDDNNVKSKFPVLKSSRREIPPVEKPKTELSQIKLKKASDWKVSYSWAIITKQT